MESLIQSGSAELCVVMNQDFSCMLQRGVFEDLVRNTIVNASLPQLSMEEESSWYGELFQLLVLVAAREWEGTTAGVAAREWEGTTAGVAARERGEWAAELADRGPVVLAVGRAARGLVWRAAGRAARGPPWLAAGLAAQELTALAAGLAAQELAALAAQELAALERARTGKSPGEVWE